jgi:hypothetical protein
LLFSVDKLGYAHEAAPGGAQQPKSQRSYAAATSANVNSIGAAGEARR